MNSFWPLVGFWLRATNWPPGPSNRDQTIQTTLCCEDIRWPRKLNFKMQIHFLSVAVCCQCVDNSLDSVRVEASQGVERTVLPIHYGNYYSSQ